MTRSTRYFLIGSAVVVTLGIGTGLVAYYNGGLPMGSGRSADADLAYLPADASAVAFADVRTIMASEFRQKLRQVLPTGEELGKFKDELGVDLERDIDTVAAAYMGGASHQSAVVVVRGRFNDVQIETLATQHGGVVGEYNGKRLITMNGSTTSEMGSQANHPVATLAFLEPGVLALGESDGVRRAIDAGASGDTIRKNEELSRMINEVRGTGTAWFVGGFEAIAQDTGLPAEITSHMPAVNLFAASVRVNGGLSGSLRAEARDETAAEQLRDVVRGALAAGHLMTGQNAKLDAMLSSLQLAGTGKTVALTFTIPPEMLDLLNGIAAARELATGDVIHK